MSWLTGWSEGANKRLCRFLIHRYLGHLLKEKLSLEQLSVDLYKGTGSIHDVNVDADFVNETLRGLHLPLRLVDGFVGTITASVPWSSLLHDSSLMVVRNLELTLRALPSGAAAAPDLVASMLESVMGSMASSVELARSFLADEEATADEGVESFAQLLDALLSRMRLVLEQTVVRVEREPTHAGALATALELRVERMEFVDQQLEACDQAGASTEPITTQPHSLYAVTDLNKLLHLQGVRFYTDVYSRYALDLVRRAEACCFRPETSTMQSMDVPVLTSMYIRRRQAKMRETMQLSSVDVDSQASTASSSVEFQSCTSHAFGSVYSNESDLNQAPLSSDPIQVVALSGERQTLRVRLRTDQPSLSAAKRVDIQMFLGGLAVLLSPSQLILLRDLVGDFLSSRPSIGDATAKLHEKQMTPLDFARVETQLHGDLTTDHLWTASIKDGNWSGEEHFFAASKTTVKQRQSEEFTSIDVGAEAAVDSPAADAHRADVGRPPSAAHSAITQCLARLSSLWVVLSHSDPLADGSNVEQGLATLRSRAAHFFQASSHVGLSARVSLPSLRAECDASFEHDHLRFVGCPVVVKLTSEESDDADVFCIRLSATNCELLECLSPSSVVAPATPVVQLLHFLAHDGGETWADEPSLVLKVISPQRTSLKQQTWTLGVELAPCRSEVDISIVDRLSNLINCRPSFGQGSSARDRASTSNLTGADGLDLRDDLFAVAASAAPAAHDVAASSLPPSHACLSLGAETAAAPKLRLDVRCAEWTVDVCVPIADLRAQSAAPSRAPWWVRRLHAESLQLDLSNARLCMPPFDPAAVHRNGQLSLTCNQAVVSFNGLNGTATSHKIAFAKSGEGGAVCSYVCCQFEWDVQNKSLRMSGGPDGRDGGSAATTSSWGSFFKLAPSNDGPFSKRIVVHENEELVIVGSKQELQDFRQRCLDNTDFSVTFALPVVHLTLPDKPAYELLYNRIVNDFGLWQPSAPSLGGGSASVCGGAPFDSIHALTLDGAQQFALCRSVAQHRDSDDDDAAASESSTVVDRPPAARRSHKLCLSLECRQVRVLLGTTVLHEQEPVGRGQIALELSSATELFLVSSYLADPNVVYFYCTIAEAALWHRNLQQPANNVVSCDVSSAGFAKMKRCDLRAEPSRRGVVLGSLVDDDNFSVALRAELNADSGVKEILTTLGVRNTTAHLAPVSRSGDFWLTQLIEFFDVRDFAVAGYEAPRVVTPLHVHAWSCALAYDHASPVCPAALRLWLDSADVSSRIAQQFALLRLRCLFEESRLFVARRSPTPADLVVRFADEPDDERRAAADTPDAFVCAAHVGLFDLEVLVADALFNAPSAAAEPRRTPLLEIRAHNDRLRVATCADSLSTLLLVVADIARQQETAAASEPSASNDNANPPSNTAQLPEAVQEHLQEMVRSAIEHTVEDGSAVTDSAETCAMSLGAAIDEALGDSSADNEAEAPTPRTPSFGSEDGFCIVDEIPGSGVTSVSGEPRIRWLLPHEEKLVIRDDHFAASNASAVGQPMASALPGCLPLIRYSLRDFTVVWRVYSGADFASFAAVTPKPYSLYADGAGKRSAASLKADPLDSGGRHRDESVSVEFQLSKISYLYELFGAESPTVSRQLLTVQDAEARGRLAVSKMHKLLYQYASERAPRRTCAPMLAVRVRETAPGEARLKLSLLPIRVNMDQDTLEFLQDFFAAVADALPTAPRSPAADGDEPHIEVAQRPQVPNPLSATATAAALADAAQVPDLLQDSISTLDGFFNPNAGGGESVELLLEAASRGGQLSPVAKFSKTDETLPYNLLDDSPFLSSGAPVEQLPTSNPGNELFFTSFVFSPAVTIRLDYEGGQRVNMRQGAVQGLLIGLSQLYCTELRLNELSHRQGLLGVGRCAQFALDEWLADIRRHQLPHVIGSVGPLSSLVEIGAAAAGERGGSGGAAANGVRDLFVLPVDEYCKEDGHVVKGIRRGAESFGASTAAAVVDAGQRVLGIVHELAEFAFDIVTPEYPAPRRRARVSRQPADVREGFAFAYDALREGVSETAEVLQLAAQEERAQGRWPVRGLLRQLTPTVLRPIVVTSRATGHLLSGLRSQLRPDARREDEDKWRLPIQ